MQLIRSGDKKIPMSLMADHFSREKKVSLGTPLAPFFNDIVPFDKYCAFMQV